MQDTLDTGVHHAPAPGITVVELAVPNSISLSLGNREVMELFR